MTNRDSSFGLSQITAIEQFTLGLEASHESILTALSQATKHLSTKIKSFPNDKVCAMCYVRYICLVRCTAKIHVSMSTGVVCPFLYPGDASSPAAQNEQVKELLNIEARILDSCGTLKAIISSLDIKCDVGSLEPYNEIASLMCKLEQDVTQFFKQELSLYSVRAFKYLENADINLLLRKMGLFRSLAIKSMHASKLDLFALHVYNLSSEKVDALIVRSNLTKKFVREDFPEFIMKNEYFWSTCCALPKRNVWDLEAPLCLTQTSDKLLLSLRDQIESVCDLRRRCRRTEPPFIMNSQDATRTSDSALSDLCSLMHRKLSVSEQSLSENGCSAQQSGKITLAQKRRSSMSGSTCHSVVSNASTVTSTFDELVQSRDFERLMFSTIRKERLRMYRGDRKSSQSSQWSH